MEFNFDGLYASLLRIIEVDYLVIIMLDDLSEFLYRWLSLLVYNWRCHHLVTQNLWRQAWHLI